MRMGVFFGRTPVRSPAGVSDPVGSVEGIELDGLFEVAQLAFGATHLEALTVTGYGDSCRVISAIFQTTQAINDDGDDSLLSNVTDNAAHQLCSIAMGMIEALREEDPTHSIWEIEVTL